MTTTTPHRPPFKRKAPAPAASRWAPTLGLFLLGAPAGLSAACSAEADIPRVVFERDDLRFEGASALPFDLGISQESRRIETEFDHPGDLSDLSVDVELYATLARIVGHDGDGDLSFIEGLELTVASRSPGAPEPITLATYSRRTDRSSVTEVSLVTASDANVFDYWKTEEPYYVIAAWGTLPQEDWSVDVLVEFRGNLRVSL